MKHNLRKLIKLDPISQTKEYRAFVKMKERCYSKNCKQYPDYGGRGIIVCDRWLDNPRQFIKDMGKKPTGGYYSIDRIENDGNYEPNNCRWANRKQQANNRRSCVLVTYCGETLTVTQWSEILGIKSHTLAKRLRSGWSIEKSFTTDVG